MFAFQPLFLFFVRRCLLCCVDAFMFILEIVLNECVFAFQVPVLYVWGKIVVQGCTFWVILCNPSLLLYPIVPATLWTLALVAGLHGIKRQMAIELDLHPTPLMYTVCEYFVVCFWLAVYYIFCEHVITPEVAAYMAYNGYNLYTI